MSEQLARSAFELFADYGFGNVNLEQIAKNAGVTKGSLYWHYTNKQELILAACQYYYRMWHEHTQRLLASIPQPKERLIRTVALSVDNCIIDKRNRLFTTAVFMLMQDDPDVRDSWKQFYSTVREMYIGLVMAIRIKDPTMDPAIIRRDVDLMLEAMEGLKIRAGFEKQITDIHERHTITNSLVSIFHL